MININNIIILKYIKERNIFKFINQTKNKIKVIQIY
jgi:hypothetical protein